MQQQWNDKDMRRCRSKKGKRVRDEKDDDIGEIKKYSQSDEKPQHHITRREEVGSWGSPTSRMKTLVQIVEIQNGEEAKKLGG